MKEDMEEIQKKDEWYSNRILWKAGKHKIFGEQCFKFSDISTERANIIIKTIPENIYPVIIFWESEEKWTAMGTRAVASFYDKKLVLVNIEDVPGGKMIYLPPGAPPEDIKTKCTLLELKRTGQFIWAPAGNSIIGLWNILNMFPLSMKNIL